MKKSKVLIGASLITLALFALIFSAFKPEEKPNSKVAISTVDKQKDVLGSHGTLLYKKHQEELGAAVKAYFEKAIAEGDIVGAGVSIVKNDSVVISDGYGKRQINSDAVVDGGTIFRLGSLSKGFAGVLATELKDEGKLHWEDKVSDFIPEFRLGDTNNTNKITLANILSHTSGTPYHSYTNLVEAGLPLQDIAKRFKAVKPISEPGSMYSYQNAMFALCGEMIHKVTGQDIGEVLTNTFFNPLGMCSTTMDYESLSHMENVAMPHTKRRNSWRTLPLSDNYYNAIAAGGISASAVDMAKWMRFLLGYNPELMTKNALAETFTPFIEIKGESKYYQRWPGHTSSYYGFGWRIHKFLENGSNNEKTIWHHGGSVNNYRNEIAIYPEAELGICVLLSNNSKIAKNVIPDLYKIVNDIFEDNSAEIALHTNKSAVSPL
ncbi:beta-lactamase family protein [Arenibacter sp. BSSL-BM3]|uniref:Beta-lactamase family protein n=1 Tax=Arenibacter arenosicollis TaxID=2762274 RepID=A0ABR7QMH1_9FLAO|nr:serine hydrolase domain-containing protein [Arenibacter arenosicollis]MBC8768120.1 beta-lactamase family protein [Arenibacter arenosicollis]